MLKAVDQSFCDALEHQNFHLVYKSFKYNDRVAKGVAKWAEVLQGQMKSNNFESFYSISIIRF